jgi:hypothetical protein
LHPRIESSTIREDSKSKEIVMNFSKKISAVVVSGSLLVTTAFAAPAVKTAPTRTYSEPTATRAHAPIHLVPMLGFGLYSPSVSPLATGESSSGKIGFDIGVLAGFEMNPDLLIEVGLLNNGNSVDLQDSSGSFNISSRSWEIPIGLRYFTMPNFSIGGGVYYESFSSGTVTSGTVSADFNWTNSSQFGLKIGGRYHLPLEGMPAGLIFDLSYKLGLSNRAQSSSGISYKDRSLALMFGGEFSL